MSLFSSYSTLGLRSFEKGEGELIVPAGLGGGKSWVRIVPAGFELIFLPFSWLLRRAKAFRRSCWLIFKEKKAAPRLFPLS